MEEKKDSHPEQPDDDRVIFIPDDDLRAIERTLLNVEQAQTELRKIRDGLNLLLLLKAKSRLSLRASIFPISSGLLAAAARD